MRNVALENTRIVLCAPSHAGNIGAAARAMKTMGLDQLTLVSPVDVAAHQSHEAVRRASRAHGVLAAARVCRSLDEALAGVAFAVACTARSRSMAVPAAGAREAMVQLAGVARSECVALVFGNETSGLSTLEVNRCQLAATIPTDSEYGSLNLAAAVQVMTYELRMALAAPVSTFAPALELASHEELEGLYAQMEREFLATGFINPVAPKKLMDRFRRLFARTQLEREEVNILRGMIRTLREPKIR
jgi:tRNA/rRNA methyltransferase